jgi:opacity protein-like surface antigen
MNGTMRRLAATAIVVAAAGAGASAAYAEMFGMSEWYVKGFGGATWPSGEDGQVKSGGTNLGSADFDFDTGYTLGAAIGAYFTPNISLELEYAYRDADSDVSGVFGDLGGDTNSNAFLLNAIYWMDGMGPNAAWQPYFGGGLGWANVEAHVDTVGNFKRDDAFGYQLMAGVAYDVNPAFSILGEVRWYGTDSGEFSGPGNLSWDGSFETFDLLVGATYNF